MLPSIEPKFFSFFLSHCWLSIYIYIYIYILYIYIYNQFVQIYLSIFRSMPILRYSDSITLYSNLSIYFSIFRSIFIFRSISLSLCSDLFMYLNIFRFINPSLSVHIYQFIHHIYFLTFANLYFIHLIFSYLYNYLNK